jgi:hypothetical protein
MMQDAELCDVWKGYHEAEARELGYVRRLPSCCIFSRTLPATAIPTARATSPPKEEEKSSVLYFFFSTICLLVSTHWSGEELTYMFVWNSPESSSLQNIAV